MRIRIQRFLFKPSSALMIYSISLLCAQAMHKKMFDWGMESGEWPSVDGFVYLDVDIAIAQTRVARRG